MDRIPVSSFPVGLKMTQGYGPFVSLCTVLSGGEAGVVLEKAEKE